MELLSFQLLKVLDLRFWFFQLILLWVLEPLPSSIVQFWFKSILCKLDQLVHLIVVSILSLKGFLSMIYLFGICIALLDYAFALLCDLVHDFDSFQFWFWYFTSSLVFNFNRSSSSKLASETSFHQRKRLIPALWQIRTIFPFIPKPQRLIRNDRFCLPQKVIN